MDNSAQEFKCSHPYTVTRKTMFSISEQIHLTRYWRYTETYYFKHSVF